MKRILSGMLAGLAMLGSFTQAFAMAEYSGEEIVLSHGCWVAQNANYTASGEIPGKVYLLVRMTPIPADAARGGLTASGHLNKVPNLYTEPGGKAAGTYKGMNEKGAAIFYVPKKALVNITYTDGEGGGYEGYMEVCVTKH